MGHFFAKGYMPRAAGQEILCQRSIEEFRLVRDYIVEDGNDFAVFFQPAGDIAEGWSEIGHPVADDHQVRLPVADRPVGFPVCERISRIQESFAFDGYGVIVLRYELCLAREKEPRILSFEIESLDRAGFTQFQV